MLKEATLIKRAIQSLDAGWYLKFKSIEAINKELEKYQQMIVKGEDMLMTLEENKKILKKNIQTNNIDLQKLKALLAVIREDQELGGEVVKRAFKTLSLVFLKEVDSVPKIKAKIVELDRANLEYQDKIATEKDLKHRIEANSKQIKGYVDFLNSIPHQIKVERYKYLNRGRKVEIY